MSLPGQAMPAPEQSRDSLPDARHAPRSKAAHALRQARGDAGSPVDEMPPARSKGGAVARRRAIEFAARIMPIIEAIRADGITSCNAIARALNHRTLTTAANRAWSGAAVRALIRRSESQPAGYSTAPEAD